MAAATDAKTGAPKRLEFMVGMTCGGCKTAVTNVLKKTAGVTGIEADVEKKQVIVTGTASSAEVLAALSKWSTAAKKEVAFVKEL